jgi:hypothetical protein
MPGKQNNIKQQVANLLSGNQQGKRKGLQLKLITILRELKPHLQAYSESIGHTGYSNGRRNPKSHSTVPKASVSAADVYLPINIAAATDAALTQTPTQHQVQQLQSIHSRLYSKPCRNSKFF